MNSLIEKLRLILMVEIYHQMQDYFYMKNGKNRFNKSIKNYLIVKNNAKQFQFIDETLIDKLYSVDIKKQLLMDLDSTNCQTYGKHTVLITTLITQQMESILI